MDETLDSLSIGGLKILQAKSGYRYSLDPILLARFVEGVSCRRVVDLGTGNAVLPLLLAVLTEAETLVGIELQDSLAARAQRNVALNSLEKRISILRADVRDIARLPPAGSTDLAVSNPPYRAAGSGRIAAGDERARARHELSGQLSDFVAAAGRLLRQGGCFAVIHLVERLPQLLRHMAACSLEPKRMRFVHSHAHEAAKLVLVEGRKGGRPGLRVEPPLTIYATAGNGRNYSAEVLRMYDLPETGTGQL